MADTEIIWNGAPDLEHLLYPISKLKLLPGNYNSGDVEATALSYGKFGQRKAIVARHDDDGAEIVIAGNTQLRASRDKLGWTHIAVSWADDLDESEAVGYAVADNRTAERATVDPEKLVKFLEPIRGTDVFDATGYTDTDLQDMIAKAQKVDQSVLDDIMRPEEPEEPDIPTREPGQPVVQYQIIFDDDDQQQVWFGFLRWLKREIPDTDTVAGRLTEFLTTQVDMD